VFAVLSKKILKNLQKNGKNCSTKNQKLNSHRQLSYDHFQINHKKIIIVVGVILYQPTSAEKNALLHYFLTT